ncbi:PGF-pre-PGF domain-containing protein [Methanolobus bombayensis]|uniref:PGF-pre-PGF domain-containing protein n=1 Tax=Methanolobus bombayensis TaxID=38023 RepID=UPI001AE7DF72|nr:PGF-pre-PGF domain-containing protein [Methanolobus bombayensis]MBP1908755.1 PGF-pre-PGF domain-containing protein [Methanolobus bombayensis]
MGVNKLNIKTLFFVSFLFISFLVVPASAVDTVTFDPVTQYRSVYTTGSLGFSVSTTEASDIVWLLNDVVVKQSLSSTFSSYSLSEDEAATYNLTAVVSGSTETRRKTWTVNVLQAFNVSFSPDDTVISSRLDREPVFRLNVSEKSDVLWYLDDYLISSYSDVCNASYVPDLSETGNYSVEVHVSNPNGSISNQWYWVATPTPSQIISGGSGGGSSSGSVSSGEDYKNILVKEVNMQVVNKNVLTAFSFTEKSNPISSLEFTSSVNAGYVRMSLEVLNDRSSFVSEEPDAEVYYYININPDRTGLDNKISDTRIFFNVSQKWIDDSNIDIDSIRLNLFSGHGWKIFPARTIAGSNASENSHSNITFVSTTNAFGNFAITGKVNTSSEDDMVVIDMGGDSTTSYIEDSSSDEDKNTSGSKDILDSVLKSMKDLFIKRNPVNT